MCAQSTLYHTKAGWQHPTDTEVKCKYLIWGHVHAVSELMIPLAWAQHQMSASILIPSREVVQHCVTVELWSLATGNLRLLCFALCSHPQMRVFWRTSVPQRTECQGACSPGEKFCPGFWAAESKLFCAGSTIQFVENWNTVIHVFGLEKNLAIIAWLCWLLCFTRHLPAWHRNQPVPAVLLLYKPGAAPLTWSWVALEIRHFPVTSALLHILIFTVRSFPQENTLSTIHTNRIRHLTKHACHRKGNGDTHMLQEVSAVASFRELQNSPHTQKIINLLFKWSATSFPEQHILAGQPDVSSYTGQSQELLRALQGTGWRTCWPLHSLAETRWCRSLPLLVVMALDQPFLAASDRRDKILAQEVDSLGSVLFSRGAG